MSYNAYVDMVRSNKVQYLQCPVCRGKVENTWLLGVKKEPKYVPPTNSDVNQN